MRAAGSPRLRSRVAADRSGNNLPDGRVYSRAALAVVPGDAPGLTIAQDAATAGLGLVYWWANENEIHHRSFAAPLDQPGELEPADGTGLACVWELEVIDFERRAWLRDVLEGGDEQRDLAHARRGEALTKACRSGSAWARER